MTRDRPDVSLSELLVPRNETPATDRVASGEIKIIAKISFNTGTIEFREDGTTATDMILIRPGDIVMSCIAAHQGAIALYEDDAPIAATIHYASYAVREEYVHPKLLWYFLRSDIFKDRVARVIPGGIKSELTPDRLLRVPVPLPHGDEQLRLVHCLDELTTKVERVRGLRSATTGALPRVMLSALGEVFSAFDEKKPWSEVISFKPRSGPSFRTDPEWSGTPVLMPSSVTGFGVNTSRVEYGIGDETFSDKDRLQPGDIIIARGNKIDQVGNAGVVPEEARDWVAANLLMRLQVDPDNADPQFCIYWLRSPEMREHVRRSMTGTNPNIQKINQRSILAFPFPAHVEVDAQRDVVSYLDRLQEKVDLVSILQGETASEVKTLAPSLLSAAFNGTL